MKNVITDPEVLADAIANTERLDNEHSNLVNTVEKVIRAMSQWEIEQCLK